MVKNRSMKIAKMNNVTERNMHESESLAKMDKSEIDVKKLCVRTQEYTHMRNKRKRHTTIRIGRLDVCDLVRLQIFVGIFSPLNFCFFFFLFSMQFSTYFSVDFFSFSFSFTLIEKGT